jgi:hypothetical protein
MSRSYKHFPIPGIFDPDLDLTYEDDDLIMDLPYGEVRHISKLNNPEGYDYDFETRLYQR